LTVTHLSSRTLKLSLQYVTNFQPNSNIETLTKTTNKGVFKNNKIFCKNFIIFVVLLRRMLKTSTPTVFVKPTYKNTYNILRAPYKNKISKHQICLSRFYMNISFKIRFNEFIFLNNIDSLFFIVKRLKNFYSFFETNISYQHRSILMFYFSFADFFLLHKYI